MDTPAANSYDALPYTTRPRRTTHPDTLATACRLAGLTTAPVDRCRVLELGCGTGGNLIPMAATLPNSFFVGIDLSAVQIADALQATDELNLRNLEWRAESITDINESYGSFDYIICHGVFSWVPSVVQDSILSVCEQRLSPNGVAYISYNTLPGWHLRAVIRDAMLYHAALAPDMASKVKTARSYIGFLAAATTQADEPYGHILKEEAQIILTESDHYIFHEFLEDDNRPFYFHEFVRRAEGFGLKFVTDVPPFPFLYGLPDNVQQMLRAISSTPIRLQQNVDFVRNRMFRRSLLCRTAAPLDPDQRAPALTDLLVSTQARPTSAEPADAAESQEFMSEDGHNVTTNNPVVTKTLRTLFADWPRPTSVTELLRRISEKLPDQDADACRQTLQQVLPQLHDAGLVALHTFVPHFELAASDRPVGFAPAQRLARRGQATVPTIRHFETPLPPVHRFLLPLLDGRRDRSVLIAELARAQAAKEVPTQENSDTAAALDAALLDLARSALLEG